MSPSKAINLLVFRVLDHPARDALGAARLREGGGGVRGRGAELEAPLLQEAPPPLADEGQGQGAARDAALRGVEGDEQGLCGAGEAAAQGRLGGGRE
jgi:hypothetical protein